jgi:hypothetical protein
VYHRPQRVAMRVAEFCFPESHDAVACEHPPPASSRISVACTCATAGRPAATGIRGHAAGTNQEFRGRSVFARARECRRWTPHARDTSIGSGPWLLGDDAEIRRVARLSRGRWQPYRDDVVRDHRAPRRWAPQSASDYRAWWSNERGGTRHVQSRAWRAAGYVANPDLANELAQFARRDGRRRSAARPAALAHGNCQPIR